MRFKHEKLFINHYKSPFSSLCISGIKDSKASEQPIKISLLRLPN